MLNIGEYLKNPIEIKQRTLQDVKNELWKLITSEKEAKLMGTKNATMFFKTWKGKYPRYNRENYDKFLKTKDALTTLKYGEFAYRTMHLKKKEDWEYILSVSKDKIHRKESVGAYIRSLTCTQKKTLI